MKKTVVTFIGVVAMVVALHAFRALQPVTITGKIISKEKVQAVMVVDESDTLKTSLIDGLFAFSVKPGNWKLIIERESPLREVVLQVKAADGKATDLGDITFQ
jgi:hypothetical protein